MLTFTTTIQHSIGSLGHSNQSKKRNKRIQIGKEIKLSLFADDIILYIENPKDSTRKLLELNNEYSKVEEHKINNTEKSLVFLCTNNERTEREIKEAIPFTTAMKKIKYLGRYLLKETKDLYIENYKVLVKEIKENNRLVPDWERSTSRLYIVTLLV